MSSDGAGDCAGHAKGHGMDAPCCGFGCHVFAPVVSGQFAVRLPRVLARAVLHDDQVGGGLPLAIERPPRMG